ncbi:MAG: hypothetical protein ACJ74Q_09785 [Pyrinomonadaceae bacterium]
MAIYCGADFHPRLLYDLLVRPLRDRLKTKRLCVVPHGALN